MRIVDVHKKLVVACVRILDSKDGTVQSTLRKFGTMTADLLELRQWLAELRVTHVAMESTGIYWQPVFNLLEGHFTVWVVNAQHIKKVPGRKTDMKDAEWIAQLLQCGLLKPSFLPERELRDLTRQQTKLVQQRNAVDNAFRKCWRPPISNWARWILRVLRVSAVKPRSDLSSFVKFVVKGIQISHR